MKTGNPHLLLLRKGKLMAVKQTPLQVKERTEFSGGLGNSMQFQVESHQRAVTARSRTKQSELSLSLTAKICLE